MKQSGYTLGQIPAWIALTDVRLRADDPGGARAALDQAVRLWFPCASRRYMAGMLSAGIDLGIQDEVRAETELRRALASGAKHGLECTMSEHLFRRTTATLCAFALRHGIEPDYVKKIIRAQRLAAPSPDLEEWPWPVRIRALGAFSLEIEDRPVSFSGKAPKKPLELLKALVAMGGTNVDIGWLGDQLWPEAEGDAARDAFHVTHSRLRKLLPMEGVFILSEGKLSLNPL